MEQLMNVNEWFVATYDDVVRESAGDRMDHRKARDETIRRYIDGVRAGDIVPFDIDPSTAAGWIFDHTVKPARKARRSSMRKAAQTLLDVLAGDTTLDLNDPILDYAYMIGDGSDKVLRYWAQEDWIDSAMERYRNAAAATQAAKDFDALSQGVVAAMKTRHSIFTGDMYEGDAA
jgi:hypothetical protein